MLLCELYSSGKLYKMQKPIILWRTCRRDHNDMQIGFYSSGDPFSIQRIYKANYLNCIQTAPKYYALRQQQRLQNNWEVKIPDHPHSLSNAVKSLQLREQFDDLKLLGTKRFDFEPECCKQWFRTAHGPELMSPF